MQAVRSWPYSELQQCPGHHVALCPIVRRHIIRAILWRHPSAGSALSRMGKFIAEVLIVVFYVLFLSFVVLGIYQLDQIGVINLRVLNELPQWLVDALFVALIIIIWVIYRLIWKKAKQIFRLDSHF